MVSWTKPSIQTGGLAVGYEVEYTYDGSTSVLNTTDVTIELPCLGPSTSVQFTVRAYSNCGLPGPETTTAMASCETNCLIHREFAYAYNL